MTSDWLCEVMLVSFKTVLEGGEKRGRRKMRGEWKAGLMRRAPHERRRIRGSEEGNKKKKRSGFAQQEQAFRDGGEKQTSVKGRREILPAAVKAHWADHYKLFD